MDREGGDEGVGVESDGLYVDLGFTHFLGSSRYKANKGSIGLSLSSNMHSSSSSSPSSSSSGVASGAPAMKSIPDLIKSSTKRSKFNVRCFLIPGRVIRYQNTDVSQRNLFGYN